MTYIVKQTKNELQEHKIKQSSVKMINVMTTWFF